MTAVVKQIQGTIRGILFILIGSPLLAISYGGITGEIKKWHDVWGIVDHAGLAAFCLSCGWIVLASPLAQTFKQYLSAAKEVTTDAAGNVTTKEQSVEIKVPVTEAAKTP